MSTGYWKVTAGGVTGCPVGTAVELTDDGKTWRIRKIGGDVVQALAKATTVARRRGDELILTNADEGIDVTFSPGAGPEEARNERPRWGAPANAGDADLVASAAAWLLLLAGTSLALVIAIGLFGGGGHSCDPQVVVRTIGLPVILIGAVAALVGALVFKRLGWNYPVALVLAFLAAAPPATAIYALFAIPCGIG